MTHILHLLDHSLPLHSGYSFRTHSILREQRALGWHTTQITSAKQGDTDSDSDTVDGLVYHRGPQPARPWRDLPVINQLAVSDALRRGAVNLVAASRPDVIHAHSSALNGLAGLGLKRRFGLPLVYELRAFWEDAAVDHGTTNEGSLRYRLTRALESHVVRRADAVTTICEGIRGDLIDRGISASKITVIPNAVNLQQFTCGAVADPDLLAQLGLANRTVLGFIGSFYAYEGIDLLISALPLIRKEHPDVALLLVGGGFQDQALRRQAREAGVARDVVFTGRVPHDTVNRYYDLVDVLVYPRQSMRLTELVTPLKPLEAMAQGRLVVASDVGGHRELIRDGDTGALFRAGDVAALARATSDLLASRSDWPMRIDAARCFVEQERSWRASVARYAPVYENLTGSSSALARGEV